MCNIFSYKSIFFFVFFQISTSNFTDTNKPVYYLDAAMHAREWVTVPVALYVIHRLVEDLREEDRDLLENIDWIVLPIVNADGYEYSHTDVSVSLHFYLYHSGYHIIYYFRKKLF